MNPPGHMQVSFPSSHNPRILSLISTHSIEDSHLSPVNPSAQIQEKELIPSLQVPLFLQMTPSHSLISISHFFPVNPFVQLQVTKFLCRIICPWSQGHCFVTTVKQDPPLLLARSIC